jgi:hypothetical protein
MAKERIIYNTARLTGILLVGAAVIHATLGTAEVMTAIKLGDVRVSMADTVRTVWLYSTVMLLLSAVWVFFIAGELRQMKRRAWWQGIFLGLGYAGSAITAIVTIGVYVHLVAFALIGLLLLLPLIVWAGHFKSLNNKSTISANPS